MYIHTHTHPLTHPTSPPYHPNPQPRQEARLSSPELNIEYRMPVDEYQRLTPYASELEENWGPPPGSVLHILQCLCMYVYVCRCILCRSGGPGLTHPSLPHSHNTAS